MTNKELVYLDVAAIEPHQDNPRKDLGDLTELAESIKANGILQNLTVVPGEQAGTYRVIIGHRRLAAAKLAGLDRVPCVVVELDEKTQIATMLTENMQRHDLTPYEQAQSFAQLLDFGMSVEEIAEKSGFSASTVRRRAKMAELNQEVLKEISDRQINLADFDELAKIEDIDKRNSVLAQIGTRDFDLALKVAIREQEFNKNLPRVQAALKAAGAKKVRGNERYSGRFDRVGSYDVFVQEWKDSDIPKVNGRLYYYIQSWDGQVFFYTERKRAKPVKKTEQDKAREQAIADAWAELEKDSALAYELRQAFVDKLRCTQQNIEKVLRGALYAGTTQAVSYGWTDNEAIIELLNIDQKYGEVDRVRIAKELPMLPQKYLPQLIYLLFGDNKDALCEGYKNAFPEFRAKGRVLALYNWLEELGYEKSTMEEQLLDGSHAAYHRSEAWRTKQGAK